MIEKEGWGVDESPGEVLGGGEAFVEELAFAEGDVAAELDEDGINQDRFLGVGVFGFQREPLRVGREGL